MTPLVQNLNMFSFEERAGAGPEFGTKGERTRARIREIALTSFRERGYEETTIRRIAEEAGVSVGVTNYHFPSKIHLVQELYQDTTGQFHELATLRMAGQTDLIQRLRTAYTAGIEVLQPFHQFAPGYLAAAISPRSPINPLSGESEPALTAAVAVFREAVDGSRNKLPADIATRLPEALAIAYFLLLEFFTYDRSPGQKRTFDLVNAALGLAKPVLPLLRLPAVQQPVRTILDLVSEVRS